MLRVVFVLRSTEIYPALFRFVGRSSSNLHSLEEERRKEEEGRRKKKEGRRKKEGGRRKKEDERRKKEV